MKLFFAREFPLDGHARPGTPLRRPVERKSTLIVWCTVHTSRSRVRHKTLKQKIPLLGGLCHPLKLNDLRSAGSSAGEVRGGRGAPLGKCRSDQVLARVAAKAAGTQKRRLLAAVNGSAQFIHWHGRFIPGRSHNTLILMSPWIIAQIHKGKESLEFARKSDVI